MRNALIPLLLVPALLLGAEVCAQDSLGAAALRTTAQTPVVTPPPVTATDFFNKASKEYVKDKKPEALRTLDKALKSFPGDPRLLKLAEELVKEEQQQQKQQQQQQQEQQEQQQKEEQQQKQQQGQDKQEQQQAQQKQQQPAQPEIAPRDAQRILDALQREEKDVQRRARMRQRHATRRPIEKDW